MALTGAVGTLYVMAPVNAWRTSKSEEPRLTFGGKVIDDAPDVESVEAMSME